MEYSVVCKSCNQRVSIGDLKADKSGSGWICMECYKGQHPEIYPTQKPAVPQFKPRLEQTQAQHPAQLSIQPKPMKIKYYCSECGYKFYKEESGIALSKSQKYPGKCPYCNLYSVRPEKDADTLLRETIDETGLKFNRSRALFDEDL